MRTIYILSPQVDPRHEKAFELVQSRQAQEVRIEDADGYVLFEAKDYGGLTQYLWRTSQMGAPAFRDFDTPKTEQEAAMEKAIEAAEARIRKQYA
jgi:hypothetical protein